jgi:membrane associated rhomboid family serine protease
MALVEIFRSPRAKPCEHRAFVLRAVGIGSEILKIEDAFVLFVEPGASAIAVDQLRRYYEENAPRPAPPPPETLEHAWVAPSLYAFALLSIAFLAGRQFFGFDWYAAGALVGIDQGQYHWWRSITALTLHADHQHLLSNLGFGALFLFAAARLVGYGATFASTFLAAVLGNLLNSALMPATHLSIGASTMVFATLGWVAAYSWRIQYSGKLRWAHRWAPLVVGVMLLGFLGASGENTDVLGHLTGFFCGVLLGIVTAHLPVPWFKRRMLQAALAAAPLLAFALSWLAASSGGS